MAITYTDKVQNAVNPLPVEEQWRALDANEVKNEVNANIIATGAAASAASTAQGDIDTHEALTNNPHGVTKSQVGLGSVDDVQQQPIDADLTAIAALTPSNDDFIQRKSGVWVNRSIAQVRTDLLGDWINWSASLAPTGFSATTLVSSRYIDDGKTVTIWMEVTGTSNATTFTVTLPTAISANYSAVGIVITVFVVNNSISAVGRIVIAGGSTTVTIDPTITGGSWTASGSKQVRVNLTYQK